MNNNIVLTITTIVLFGLLFGAAPTVEYLNEKDQLVTAPMCALTEEYPSVPHQITTIPEGTYLIIPVSFHIIYNSDGGW